MVDFRIDAVLKDMGQTLLCELPDQTAWTVEQFLSRTEVDYFWNFTSSCPLIRITALQVVSPVTGSCSGAVFCSYLNKFYS